MVLQEVFMYELGKFLQIVLWISVPLILISLLVTTLIHYRNKKRRLRLAALESGTQMSHPNDILSATTLQEESHQFIIQQYEQQIRQGREKYQSLERSFRKLQEGYSNLISKESSGVEQNMEPFIQEKIKNYERRIVQMEQALAYYENNPQYENGASAIPENVNEQTIRQLELAIEKLTENLSRQVADNEQLREELEVVGEQPVNKEKDALIQQLKEMLGSAEEENGRLKNSVGELNCTTELLQEKQAQNEFLQQQLDQRIRNHFPLEQQLKQEKEAVLRIQQLLVEGQLHNNQLEMANSQLNNELHTLKANLDAAGEKNLVQRDMLQAKEASITDLTNQMNDLQLQKTNLNASIAGFTARIPLMETALASAMQRTKEYEEKWEQNSRLLSKLYAELGTALDKERLLISESGTLYTADGEAPVLDS